MALDNGATCLNSNAVANLLGQDATKFARKYDGGMFKEEIRKMLFC